ncbi:MAG: energy coupling factor transporter S component ThiW [Chloroflexi bacterium]|nr:energy coupling factor transporter S component ThiW [Chloroflexota bacterium]
MALSSRVASTQVTRRVAYSVILAALGVALSWISIPIGPARVSPTQHMVNVVGGGLVGPWWGLGVAVVISTIRLATGLGTPLAFPGSIFGAVLAGLTYRYTRNIIATAVAEVIGTGLIGAIVAAGLVAPYLLNRPMELTALIVPFMASSVAGAVLGAIGLAALRRAGWLNQGG